MQCARVVAVAGALVLSTSMAAPAETPELVEGSRVRVKVSTENRRVVGKLLGLDDRSLNLQVEDEEAPRVFPREHIADLDISAGRRSLGRRALYGTMIGAVAGAAVVYGSSDPDDDLIFTREEGAGIGALIFGAAGALVGMLVIPAERWRNVPLDSIQVSFRPVQGRGAGVFLTVGF